MTVAVVGPGAIGAVVAACLQRAGHTPLLCGRTAHAELVVDAEDGRVVVPGPVLTDPEAAPAGVDVVFLAVKDTQTTAAAPWLARLCRPGTVVCVLQNGVEQRATVGPLAPGAAVLASVVWFPAEPTAPGRVQLRDTPRISLPDESGAAQVRDLLDGGGCEVVLDPEFVTAAWRKLCINATAGLLVLARRRAGAFRREDLGALTAAYLDECAAVGRAEGAALPDDIATEILAHFRGMPEDLGTSMLFDAEAGRPLEWDARNGVVQRLGRRHGIATPISDVVVPLLAAASSG